MAETRPYVAIARKWRPNRFADLVGQESVVRTLSNAIESGRVAHAFLFAGARGVGKTSVARLFAKALRCPNRQGVEPCNQCEECRAVSESRSLDVAEIDGASNNGVEAVRAIRDNVAYAPAAGFYKIYIIDEVHMLSISAFNALLKTLEEPPSHVLFFFATTEPQKLPATILSRCLRFEFRRLSVVQIVKRLGQILEEEKVAASEAALQLLAQQADGSLRDALSLLDQTLAFASADGGTALEEKTVVEALGVSPATAPLDLIDAILRQDSRAIVDELGKHYEAGLDLTHFGERCLDELRALFLLAMGREDGAKFTAAEFDASAARFERLTELSSQAPGVRFERMAQLMAAAMESLVWTSRPRFALEMAALRMAKLDGLERFEAALAKGTVVVEATAPGVTTAPVVTAPVPTATAPVATAPQPVRPPAVAEPVRMAPPPQQPSPRPSYEEQPPPMMEEMPPPVGYEMVPQPEGGGSGRDWKSFVEAVSRKRPLLGALLHHASCDMLTEANKPLVQISFAEGSFYERQAYDTKNKRDIEEWVRNFFGNVGVRFGSKPEEQVASLQRAQDDRTHRLKRAALEDTGVLAAKDVLGADIVDVDVPETDPPGGAGGVRN